MPDSEFWQLSAKQLLVGYAQRHFSPVEVLSELYARIEQLNPHLSAFLALNVDDATRAAHAAEKTWLSSKEKPLLCGVPISIKDSFEMAGCPTTYGSLAFQDNYQSDSEIVRRIRQAGGVIIGKTNLPEFALHQAVDNRLSPLGRNPWNLDHTCGGSSGGAASAVAVGLGPLAIGTDAAGSIRTPAANNGIFGIKPTFQRIPSVQAWRAAPGRSHNGPLTRTVEDSALLLRALSGFDPRDPDSSLPPMPDSFQFAPSAIRAKRVAVSYDFGRGFEMNPEVLALVKEAADLLYDLGYEIIEADPPTLMESEEMEPGVWAYAGDHLAAAEAICPNFLEKHADELGPIARSIYEAGQHALAWQYRRILRRNRAFAQGMQQWFQDYDFLLSPLDGPAPRHEEVKSRDRSYPSVSFASPFNHTYNPAAAIPFGFHSNGMPLSVQIVGRLSDDLGVLQMAAAVEAARPWVHQWPSLAAGVTHMARGG